MSARTDMLPDILQALGKSARREGSGHRARAIWRGGDDYNVSITPKSTAPGGCVWHDHATGEGGHGAKLARLLGITTDAPVQKPQTFADAREWCSHRSLRWGVLVDRFNARATKASIVVPTPCGIDRIRYINPRDGHKTQWRPGGGKACAYGLEQSRDLLTEGAPLYIVNGEPSVWAAVQSGVPAVCFCAGEGAKVPVDILRELASTGAPLRIVYDHDKGGSRGARKLASAIAECSPETDVQALNIASWAGWGDSCPDKADVDDLHRRTGDNALATALASLEPLELPAPDPFTLTAPEADGGKPQKHIGAPQDELNDYAVEVLSKRPDVYVHNGVLVSVCNDHDAPRAWESARDVADRYTVNARPLSKAGVLHMLSEEAEWIAGSAETETLRTVKPPQKSVDYVVSEGHTRPEFRRISGIVAHPVLKGDPGALAVLSRPGYDPASGLWVGEHRLTLDVPKEPTRDDAIRARDTLLELVDEVPFESDVHRAVYLAAMLTPPSMFTFGDPLPMFIIQANQAGAGKTRLARIITSLWTGQRTAMLPYTSDDAEMQKRLLASAIAGQSLIVLDNVKDRIGGGALESAITAGKIKGRLLGVSTMVEADFRPFVLATVNNAELTTDMTQRCLLVNLEHDGEIHERLTFRIADVDAHLAEHRSRYISAALTMVLAYDRAGRPRCRTKGWRDFRGFTGLVLESIVWAGMPDPYESTDDMLAESLSPMAALATMAPRLPESWTAADAIKAGAGDSLLREALASLCDGDVTASRLRTALRSFVSRWIAVDGGRVALVEYRDARHNARRFRWKRDVIGVKSA